MISKYCHKCKLDKPLENFSPDPRGRIGLDNACKECRKVTAKLNRLNDPDLRKKNREQTKTWRQKNRRFFEYGITNDRFHEMVAEQGGRCALCGTDKPKAPSWCIDHDHDSLKVRGLLCHTCNTALGGYEKMMKISGHIRLENYIRGINPHDSLVY